MKKLGLAEVTGFVRPFISNPETLLYQKNRNVLFLKTKYSTTVIDRSFDMKRLRKDFSDVVLFYAHIRYIRCNRMLSTKLYLFSMYIY